MRNFLKSHKWASAEDRKDYESRAENFRDGKFYNDGDFQIP